jgi:hypothetical protein
MKPRIRVAHKEAIVYWLLLNYPHLPNDEICEIAECSRGSLYRMRLFKLIRQLLREDGANLLPRNGSGHGYDPVSRDDESP